MVTNNLHRWGSLPSCQSCIASIDLPNVSPSGHFSRSSTEVCASYGTSEALCRAHQYSQSERHARLGCNILIPIIPHRSSKPQREHIFGQNWSSYTSNMMNL